jgi:CRISP-associated protein Cas1
MTDRIIDISSDGAALHARNGLLVIERDGAEATAVPFGDLAALVVAHPRVSFTQSVVSELAEAGGMLVTCDARYLPSAMLLPMQAHFTQTERLAAQVGASKPTAKRLWQQIVRAKITAQGRLLAELHGDDLGLPALARRVRSGDPENREAQAARRYWRLLFADDSFRREPDRDDANRLLNYAYAVLRATVARALCAAGLHPSIGLHHHNRYNPFCLADDLMEPFRPVADGAVVRRVRDHGPDAPLDREAKAALIAALTGRYRVAGEERTLFDLLARTAASLVAVFAGERRDLLLPEL